MMTSDHRNQVREFIQLLFDPGESFYTKTGHGSFQYNEVNEGGDFRLRQTYLSNSDGLVGQEHSETRHLEITAHDGIDYLTGRERSAADTVGELNKREERGKLFANITRE